MHESFYMALRACLQTNIGGQFWAKTSYWIATQVSGIESALLIFSHDLWDADINALIAKIDFAKYTQIFYPYSNQGGDSTAKISAWKYHSLQMCINYWISVPKTCLSFCLNSSRFWSGYLFNAIEMSPSCTGESFQTTPRMTVQGMSVDKSEYGVWWWGMSPVWMGLSFLIVLPQHYSIVQT